MYKLILLLNEGYERLLFVTPHARLDCHSHSWSKGLQNKFSVRRFLRYDHSRDLFLEKSKPTTEGTTNVEDKR